MDIMSTVYCIHLDEEYLRVCSNYTLLVPLKKEDFFIIVQRGKEVWEGERARINRIILQKRKCSL